MDVKQLAHLAFQISLITTVFGFGLKATSEDLLYLFRRPGLLGRSLIAVVIVMPVVAVIIDRCFNFPSTVEIAIIALAVSPLPPRLPAKEAKAGGRHPYGLGLMVLLAVLSVATVPLAAHLLGAFFGREYLVSPGGIAVLIATTVLAPLAAGVVFRLVAPRLAERMAPAFALASRILMPAAALVLLIAAAPALWHLILDGTLFAIIAFLVVGFVVGHAMGGREPEHSTVLAYSTACRHPGIAVMIAAASFPDQRFGATILLYLVTAFVLGMAYSAWSRRRQELT